MVLDRIRSLAIPPAWNRVWISPEPNAHLLATGRDAKGRKQYRYHPRWRATRDVTKYDRLVALGRALPRIRRRVRRDLARTGLPRDKVLAAVVALLELTGARVGSEEYAHDNHSYGLTTLRVRHARIQGRTTRLKFTGKGGKAHELRICDPALLRIVKQCRELPGEHLFEFVDEAGAVHAITSDNVNEYLLRISGEHFTAKDYRTWRATLLAFTELRELGPGTSKAMARRSLADAIERVSGRLGNTPRICRRSYIHPALIEAYLDGQMENGTARSFRRAIGVGSGRLRADESALLTLIRHRHENGTGRGRRQDPGAAVSSSPPRRCHQ
jgi:DNA topoisomerase-1